MKPDDYGFRQPATTVTSDAFPRPAAQRVVPMSRPPAQAVPSVQPVSEPQANAVLETEPIVERFDPAALESAPPTATPSVGSPVITDSSPAFTPFRYNRLALAITGGVLLLLVLIGAGSLFWSARQNSDTAREEVNRAAAYGDGDLSLGGVRPSQHLGVGEVNQLTVNGELAVSDTLVVKPTARPQSPQNGQIYYDRTNNQLYYYNGTQFVSLVPLAGVTSVGGATGALGLGAGLVVNGGQLGLSPAILQQIAAGGAGPGVTSLQGQTGAVTLSAGAGIAINGTTISNNGVLSLASGSANLVVTNNGGNYTVTDTSGGAAVTSLTGTPNQINVSSPTGAVTLSLPQDIATTSAPTFGGLTVNGGTLVQVDSPAALQVQNAAGTSNLLMVNTNTGRIGIGTAGPGYRLDVQGGDVNTSGIYRVNGAQISSDDLSNDANLAKLDGANVFTAANTFSDTVAIQGANSLTLGSASNVGSILFHDGATANTGQLQLAGSLSGNVTYSLPVTLASQTICTVETGNCAGSGSGITGSGTINRLAKFTGGQAIGDSSITDDGTTVTVSTGQVIQGAAGLTIGNTGVNGQLVFRNSNNGNTLTLQSGATGSNLTLTLPPADGSNGNCLKTNGAGVLSFASCTGGAGGGVTSVNTLTGILNLVGTANQIDVNSAGDTITLSLPQSIQTSSNVTFRTITLEGQAAGDNLIVANAVSGATANLIDLQVDGNSQFTVSPNGNVNTTGQYQVNGVQISSADLSNDANIAKLDGTGPQTFTGNNRFNGTFLARNASDSTTAFQIQNAAGTSNLFNADTTNNRIGIGTAAPGYTLDVNGDVNTTGVYRINGVTVCAATGCTPAGGSGNYIQNGTTPQTADFNVTGSGTIGSGLTVTGGGVNATGDSIFKPAIDSATAFVVQDAGSDPILTVDTINGQIAVGPNAIPANSALTVGTDTTAATGGITFGTDTNLYRSAANILKTDDNFVATLDMEIQGGDLTTNQTTFNLLDTTATTLNFGGAATTLNIGPGGAAATSINLAGGSGATGCTVDGSNGNFTCSGNISSTATSGTQGWWARSGTNLQPATSGDNVTTSGSISTTGSGTITSAGMLTGTGGATISGGTINLNVNSSPNAVNVGTGSTTGGVSIGNTTAAQTVTIQGGTGNLALALSTGSGGTLSIGSAGVAGTLQIGNAIGAVTQTINIGNNATASSSTTLTIGSLIGASATTIQGGAGNIALTTNGVAAGVIVKNLDDSATTFQVQDAGGIAILTVDTAGGALTVNGDIYAADEIGVDDNGIFSWGGGSATSIQAASSYMQFQLNSTPWLSVGSNGAVTFDRTGDSTDAFEVRRLGGTTVFVVDTTNSRVGIGPSVTPNYTLSVVNASGNNATASIVNTSTGSNANLTALRLGIGSTSTGTTSRFIQFFAGASADNNGTGVGRIQLNNGNVAYNTGAADLAEWFDADEPLAVGEIVQAAGNGVRKAQSGTNVVGVVSDSYGFVGGYREGDEENPNRAAVGLVGQVPVKVTGDPIAPGDPIGLSATPGVGQKMTGPGQIIGYAQEAFAGGTGTVKVILQPGYYNGPTPSNYLQNGGDAVLNDLTVNGMANFANLNVSGNATIDNLTVTGSATIGTLTVTGNARFDGPTVAFSSNVRGINQSIASGAGSVMVIFVTPHTNADYAVQCTPSFNTNCYITGKTANGFTINFGTPPPDGSQTVDWFVIR